VLQLDFYANAQELSKPNIEVFDMHIKIIIQPVSIPGHSFPDRPKPIESLFNIFMLKFFGMTIDVDKKGNNQIKFVDSNNHNSDLVVFKRKCPRGVACSTAQNYEENKKKYYQLLISYMQLVYQFPNVQT